MLGVGHVDPERAAGAVEAQQSEAGHDGGRAKGRSMMALMMRLPRNSSRTRTQAMRRPATELKTATPSEQRA